MAAGAAMDAINRMNEGTARLIRSPRARRPSHRDRSRASDVNGRQDMTAIAAWQRRDRMWARVQIGSAVVAIVSATLLLCW
jgi:hypothetical protein